MYQPIVQAKKMMQTVISEFGGLNETDTITEREFEDLTNFSSHAEPFLKTRPKRRRIAMPSGLVIRKMICFDKEQEVFTGIGEIEEKRKFFYECQCVKKEGTTEYELVATDAVEFGGKYYIFPDGLYFDPAHIEAGLLSMGSRTSGTMTFSGTEDRDVITNSISNVANASAFSKGDSIVISECTAERNNTLTRSERLRAVGKEDIVSVVVEKVEGTKLMVLCYNALGEAVKLKSVTSDCVLEKEIPELSHVCVHNNRIWGTEKGGKRIYASKLGDACNYNAFAALSTDSWWSEVASQGEFTAIVSYQNHVYAFKKECIHEVYGDRPSNFKIPYTTQKGCTAGETVTEIGGALYFAGMDGIYQYGGGLPERISRKIKEIPEFHAGGTDGIRLYLAQSDGGLLVYDTRLARWYREDGRFSCFIQTDGILFAAAPDGVYQLGEGEETVSWSLKTKQMRPADSVKNAVESVWLRMQLSEGAWVKVFFSFDGGEWILVREIQASHMEVVRVPVRMRKCDRFQMMLEGKGEMKLYAIEYQGQSGGKNMIQ